MLFADRYDVKERLGSGGYGVVDRAYDRNLGIDVALKTFKKVPPGVAYAEAKALIALEGPHILRVYNADVADDVPYIASALAVAGTAEHRCSQLGVAPRQAVLWVAHLLSGLDACHRAGLLHRDVKPANLFLDSEESARLGDFGTVVLLRNGQAGPEGDPRIRAPEMWRGAGDVRSDVYSAGVTLWRILTGGWPIHHADKMSLEDYGLLVLRGVTTRLRDLAPHLPATLARVAERALSLDASARYQSAHEMQTALGKLTLPDRTWQRVVGHDGHEACWASTATTRQSLFVCTSRVDKTMDIRVQREGGSRVRAHCRVVPAKRQAVELRATFDELSKA